MKYLWTTIYVKDLEKSIAFYTELLDLHIQRRFQPGPGVEIAFLGNGLENETTVELLASSNNDRSGFGDSISLGFAVDSMDAMLEKVNSKNIPVLSSMTETPGSIFFEVMDPNGLSIQLVQMK